MLRQIQSFLAWVILFTLFVRPGVAAAESPEEIARQASMRLQRLIELRRSALEQACGIEVPHDSNLTVTFAIPKHLNPQSQPPFGIRFYAATGTFMVQPKMQEALNHWHRDTWSASRDSFPVPDDSLLLEIDREVGRAIVYDVARQSNRMELFQPQAQLEKTVGVRLLLTGMSTYFERRLSANRSTYGLGTLPSRWNNSWLDHTQVNDIFCEGGNWIVSRIIDEYGERGIIYILSHPLVVIDGNAYQAAMNYQRDALAALRAAT